MSGPGPTVLAIPRGELFARIGADNHRRVNDTVHDTVNDTITDRISWGVVGPAPQRLWDADTDPRRLIDFAVRTERLGYDSFWIGDTMLSPMLEPLTTLAAVSTATERITLGTAALLPAFRRPVHIAHSIASLDLLSAGRLALTVGAGFPGRSEPEFAMSDMPWQRRFTWLDDTVALWRRLWTATGPTSFHGRVLHFPELTPTIRPHRSSGPPIWLAGGTPGALARTARQYDGWLPYPPRPADYRSGLATIRAAAGAAGRDPAAVTPALFATVLVTDDHTDPRRALDRYCQANYGRPVDVVAKIQLLLAGPVAEIAAALRDYLAAGARHVLLRIGAVGMRAQLDQLAALTDLLPR